MLISERISADLPPKWTIQKVRFVSDLRPGFPAEATGALAELARLPLRDYLPVVQLRRSLSEVGRPAVPAVDVHNHLGRWLSPDGSWLVPDVEELLEVMDAAGVAAVVNLDGRWGRELDENIARYDAAHPGRFATFCHLDWTALTRPAPTAALIASLEASAAAGARGLKVWKDLGLQVTDATGARVLPDDDRLVDVFAAAGELGLPVLAHIADPKAFFAPLDRHNERLDELVAMPSWWFGGPEHPTFERLLDALETVLARAPGTTFIGAHVGCAAEDLDLVDRLLTTYPNFSVDLGGRLAELGRQPRRFRRLVLDHPDRVLFGTDAFPPDPEAVRTYVRFLETADEHFGYDGQPTEPDEPSVPSQGRWAISGALLPGEVLPALYAGNAYRLIRF
jgi:predicted TIM-barrel fold metal-dependent hydrolase